MDQVERESLVVIGLGYVGLPLALEATRAGLCVTGVDANPVIVGMLNGGSSHVDDISDATVADMLAHGFTATEDEGVLAAADVVVICVPTPLSDGDGPDLSYVTSAADAVARHLKQGTLVVLESTTYPGTTDDVLRPILEASGLVAGRDFSLAFSPERIDPGNQHYSFRTTPKVVGGYTEGCTAEAERFYSRIVDTVVVAHGTREAEMAKLLENTYRHVNIALVNEMLVFCNELGIDLWDSIRCAASKPFGFQPFYPGPGVGGHCIPIDPKYLSYRVQSRLGYPFRFVELAQEINRQMPRYVVSRTQDHLNSQRLPLNGADVLLLGVTYKADIADQRESPALGVAERLLERGASLSYHDPYVDSWVVAGQEFKRVDDLRRALIDSDVAILLQAHSDYANLPEVTTTILDTRATLPPSSTVIRL